MACACFFAWVMGEDGSYKRGGGRGFFGGGVGQRFDYFDSSPVVEMLTEALVLLRNWCSTCGMRSHCGMWPVSGLLVGVSEAFTLRNVTRVRIPVRHESSIHPAQCDQQSASLPQRDQFTPRNEASVRLPVQHESSIHPTQCDQQSASLPQRNQFTPRNEASVRLPVRHESCVHPTQCDQQSASLPHLPNVHQNPPNKLAITTTAHCFHN